MEIPFVTYLVMVVPMGAVLGFSLAGWLLKRRQ